MNRHHANVFAQHITKRRMNGFTVEGKGIGSPVGGLVHVDEEATRYERQTIAITLKLCIAYASNSVMGPVLSAKVFTGTSTA